MVLEIAACIFRIATYEQKSYSCKIPEQNQVECNSPPVVAVERVKFRLSGTSRVEATS